jgi:hypothetical protein
MAGHVLTTTHPTSRGAWKSVTLPRPEGGFTGVACPTTRLCVAVSNDGNVDTSTNPTGNNLAWRLGDAHVTAKGDGGLTGVSCPSPSLCVAVDSFGDVLTSRNPTGGARAWKRGQVDINFLESLSCPSVHLCVAVDNGGNAVVSRNPAAGAGSWRKVNVDPNWVGLTAVSCSAGMCVATDELGKGWTSTSGGSAWGTRQVDAKRAALNVIDCPTSSLCFAGDSLGSVLVTRHPTAAGAWRVEMVTPRGARLSAITCEGTSFCVATDIDSFVYVATNLGAGVPSWRLVSDL